MDNLAFSSHVNKLQIAKNGAIDSTQLEKKVTRINVGKWLMIKALVKDKKVGFGW